MSDDLHLLAAAYALDAVADEDERRLFEAHLTGCASCAAEVRGFRTTAVRLGAAAVRTPPPGLRERVLAEIREVPQASPATAGADVIPLRSRRPGRTRFAVALTAACLVVAAVSVGVALNAQRSDRPGPADRTVAAVLSAPDARTVTGSVTSGGTVTVVFSRSRGRAVLTSSGLRSLPTEKTYEMWLIGPHGVRAGGLVRPGADGRVRTLVAGVLADANKVGLTVEPAAGSRQPTTRPIALLGI
ncbi:anti-sigma factor [Actinoallomurus purpureus]|uniref:anti-sigma factor n=1 Tax=Actinoallomurus purpureus TaxID=478114 RepID=UPI002091F73E|nr:anti-sigma factor [Actinoallomurus purpureus]MCO6004658.1 anti-sigma factor [Actinoallomurus purpureus]